LGGSFQVSTITAINQFVAKATVDSNGNFVIVWESEGMDGSSYGISCRRYSSNGTPLSGECRGNSTAAVSQFDPFVATGTDGRFIVTWTSDLLDGSGSGVYAQRFEATGTPQGGEFRVNTFTSDNQGRSRVWVDSFGNFIVAWESRGQDASGYGVYAQRFDTNGAPVGSEFRINSTVTGDQLWAALGGDASGNFTAVWSSSQDGSGFGICGQRYDSSGYPVGSEFRVNTFVLNDQLYPSIAVDPTGRFLVVWQSDGPDGDGAGIFGQRFGATGSPQGSEFQINSYSVGAQGGPWVAAGASGGYVVVWSSYAQFRSDWAVFGRRFDIAGVPLPAP